jgi:hypothetical protein
MNTINGLLAGSSPYQVLSEQSAKLAGKWEKSGLLEGIESATEKNNMSMLLENQAKQLVNEANVTGTGTTIATGNSEAWAGVALPLVRRVFGEIVAKDLVSVQPMNLPAGLIFYLDFQYGQAGGGKAAGESLYGASSDLTRTEGAFNTGLYGAGAFGYSSNDFTSSLFQIFGKGDASKTARSGSVFIGDILQEDADFSASVMGAGHSMGTDPIVDTDNIVMVTVSQSAITDFDPEGIRGFEISGTGIAEFFPQFTRLQTGSMIQFVVRKSAAGTDMTDVSIRYHKGPDNLDDTGDFEDSDRNTTTSQGFTNSSLDIPTIDVKLKSDTVAAKTRKLKAQWTPEFAQDLNAYHSIDAEAELTSILSEYISMEIDLEILDMLIRNADTVEGWSAKVNQDVTVNSLSAANTTEGGADVPQFSVAAGSGTEYYTKMSWFQTLGIKLQKVSNIIHQKTLRGGANFMVISPKLSTVLESIPGFAADSSGDDAKYNMGVQKIGAINNRYTVYKNPYMTENIILMGYKGSQFLETGAVFAPYIPLIMTPLVYDPNSFTPRKGIMTRYAKKMVRPDFYGKVICADMDQI